MAKAEKISIIGAGSAQFSMGIVRDIALTPGLQGSQVTFMDIDHERLSMVSNLARRFNNEIGSDIRFDTTNNQKEAIKDARFVINTALAGSHQLMEDERNFQEQNGYYRGIAVHAPYRQLKLMHEVAADVEKYGEKDAYLLQSANPLPEGCSIMTRETNTNVIGLCHGYLEYNKILDLLEIPKKDIIFEATGINHCIWLTKLKADGKDIYPEIDQWVAEKSENYWKNWNPHFEEMQMSPAAIDMYKSYGRMPIGDTCRASWPESWWYHTDAETKKRWWGPHGGYDGDEGWQLHLNWLSERQQQIVSAAENPKIPLTTIFPVEKSREQIIPIIDSIANDKPDSFQVNVPNKGVIIGLPDNFVVEIPAKVDGKGVHTQEIEELPDSIMLGVLYPRWLFAERIIAAYKTGDIRFILQAYLSDQRTKSREQAEKTINSIISMPGNEAYTEKVNQFRKENVVYQKHGFIR